MCLQDSPGYTGLSIFCWYINIFNYIFSSITIIVKKKKAFLNSRVYVVLFHVHVYPFVSTVLFCVCFIYFAVFFYCSDQVKEGDNGLSKVVRLIWPLLANNIERTIPNIQTRKLVFVFFLHFQYCMRGVDYDGQTGTIPIKGWKLVGFFQQWEKSGRTMWLNLYMILQGVISSSDCIKFLQKKYIQEECSK